MMLEIERKPELTFYVDHVNAYEREAKTWESRSKKICKRYRDYRADGERKVARFNILWSNVQTLHPALYNGTPTPNVDRRYEDDEEVNITVAQILERAASYYVKTNDFDDCMGQAVLDRLLPGRGTMWIRYVPNFKDVQISGDAADGAQITDDVNPDDADQELYSEDVVADYVHWCDYGNNVARTWQENRMVWRKVYLGRKELIKRFGEEKGKEVPLDAKALGKRDDDQSAANVKGTVYELWDRVTKRVYWFHKDMEDFLDQMDDPLGLDGFYPCPKPLYATLANDTLIPTPDFLLYQDQAQELDVMTARIAALNMALKVVGVYDASAEGVQRMLSENVDNKLIPVEQWAVLAEKGGLKGVVDFFPIEMVANVLIRLYEAREKTKQDIYEITGISDIVRGSTNANETATAQQIKGQFATLRLDNMQKDVARFACDAVKIMTEIIANHFSLDTLKQVSGVRLLTEAEKQQIMMSQQPQMGMDGQPIPPKPLPDVIQKMLKKPTWEEIEAVLRNNGARCFRVDIETDSTIKADQEAEKASRIEFLTAAGTFIQQAANIPVPELQPLLMEMLKFGVSGFKAGRELDGQFKSALDAIKQKAEQPPAPPQPDPSAQAAMADAEMKKADSQMKMQESQAKLQFDDKRLAVESEMKNRELAIKERELALKEFDTQQKYALETKRMLIEYQAKMNSEVPDDSADGENSAMMMLAEKMQKSIEQKDAELMQIAQMQIAGNNAIVEAITRPKQVVRDGQGKITEVI